MKKKRPGPQRKTLAVVIDSATVIFLILMLVGGAALVIWTLWSLQGDHTQNTQELAFLGFASSVFLTGITTIYCGITGFILLENRRMRVQAIMPHVQVTSPVRAGETISIELLNAGAAQAVDLVVSAWVLKRVGGARTPDAILYTGARPALPATPTASRVQLNPVPVPKEAEFSQWQDLFARTDVTQGALDLHLLLIHIAYSAVDGTTMSDCVALPLNDQPKLPEQTRLPETAQ